MVKVMIGFDILVICIQNIMEWKLVYIFVQNRLK